MLYSQVLYLALAPTLVFAAIFPPGSHVKSVDAKGFKKAMKQNRASMVAFVAPWCGHCKNLAPEYSKAAKSLNPMVPLYAVDCDAAENKPLCAEQKIEGFPTIKLFPRGGKQPPILYSGERTASAIVDFVTQRTPFQVKKLAELSNILTWVHDEIETPRALLLTKNKKLPLIWKVLSNQYKKITFGVHRDTTGVTAPFLGLEAGETGPIVLVYSAGSSMPARYEGTTKYDPLSKFFDSVLDGTAELKLLNQEGKSDQPLKAEVESEPSGLDNQPVVMADGEQTPFSESLDAARSASPDDIHLPDFENQTEKPSEGEVVEPLSSTPLSASPTASSTPPSGTTNIPAIPTESITDRGDPSSTVAGEESSPATKSTESTSKVTPVVSEKDTAISTSSTPSGESEVPTVNKPSATSTSKPENESDRPIDEL